MRTLRVELKNVSLTYGNRLLKARSFAAVKDFSCSFKQGKIYGFIGRNGAGKTSLLSIVAGYRKATSGNVQVNGEDLFENQAYASDIIFIYQRNFDEVYLRVRKYVENTACYRPFFDLEYAYELLEKFNVPLKKRLKSLSKGQQSALSVAIGLASRCPLTIFDEAYLGMDAPTRDLFYRELLEEQGRHPRIIVMSTHLISEVEYLFDEVIMIDQGKLLVSGSYDEVIASGVSVTGAAQAVDTFAKGKRVLNTRTLGGMKEVVLRAPLLQEDELQAQDLHLEIGKMKLQDLFIQLTGGDK